MSHPSGPRDRARISDRVVDAYFDRALDEATRERLFRSMLADPRQAELMARMQRTIGLLRAPVDAPDLTDQIMARVDRRRRFLPAGFRRMISFGRLAVAAGLLVVLLGVALTQRYAPRAVSLTPPERPLTAVIDAGKADAASGARRLAGTITAITSRTDPVFELQKRVLATVERTTASDSQPGAPLTPGSLPAVRLPEDRRVQLVILGGSGTISSAPPLEVVAESQFAASRFPIAGIVSAMGGQWVWPGGPGTESCDRMFVIPVAAPPGPAGTQATFDVADDRPGGASPRK